MLRPRLRIPRATRLWRQPISFRQIHSAPTLGQFNPEEGVPGLLSPGGFDLAWTQYMNFIIGKLNTMIAEDEFEQQTPLSIVKATAREPSQAHIFNYASMAYNNHFFFENLAKVNPGAEGEPTGEDRIPIKLRVMLTKQFSSIQTLRREFLSTAMGMFGPGFVWLVKPAQSDQLRILPTYLAGTPFTAGHWRRQGVDMNTQGPASREVVDGWMSRRQTGVGADIGSKFLDQSQVAPGGTDVIPLLCLNTWEHVWLRDYGIGAGDVGGKRQFVKSWWEVINWDKVEDRANLTRPEFKY
ncbi:manganese and iron superoxide dismutase [Annulohypoxylon bovei var. microspora]|nr:manganese and iron superoxide dismutase [Annulohypoxylon bovei var. microspora]